MRKRKDNKMTKKKHNLHSNLTKQTVEKKAINQKEKQFTPLKR